MTIKNRTMLRKIVISLQLRVFILGLYTYIEYIKFTICWPGPGENPVRPFVRDRRICSMCSMIGRHVFELAFVSEISFCDSNHIRVFGSLAREPAYASASRLRRLARSLSGVEFQPRDSDPLEAGSHVRELQVALFVQSESSGLGLSFFILIPTNTRPMIGTGSTLNEPSI